MPRRKLTGVAGKFAPIEVALGASYWRRLLMDHAARRSTRV